MSLPRSRPEKASRMPQDRPVTPGVTPEASGHTPGPWRTDFSRNGMEGDDHWRVVNGTYVVAVPQLEANAEADARLIAAAPELLEVLRELYAHAISTGCIVSGKRKPELCDRIRAALAKAEGRNG